MAAAVAAMLGDVDAAALTAGDDVDGEVLVPPPPHADTAEMTNRAAITYDFFMAPPNLNSG